MNKMELLVQKLRVQKTKWEKVKNMEYLYSLLPLVSILLLRYKIFNLKKKKKEK